MWDPVRLSKQRQICSDWKKAGGVGSLEAVTGFGKTNVAMLLLEEMNKNHPERTGLVVVPTIVLKEQWEKEFKERKIKNATALVINSAVKEFRDINLLILDEMHRYAAETFQNIFKVVQYNFILGLTATMERQDGKHQLLKARCPIVATVTMKEAKKYGWVSDYRVFALGIELPEDELKAYEKLNKQFGRYFGMFGHDFKLAMSCLSDPNARHRAALERSTPLHTVTEQDVRVDAIRFSRAMHGRKKFINEHVIKLWYAKKVSDKFSKSSMLVFSETTDFADQLAEMIGDKAAPYHSGMGKKQQREVLKRFKDKRTKLKVLTTARALDEGFNVEGIDFAIICSGNSTARQAIQRIGRSIRFKKGKQAIVVNLFIKNTQDERWTTSRLSKIPNVVWINSLEEIDYEQFENEPELDDSARENRPVFQTQDGTDDVPLEIRYNSQGK